MNISQECSHNKRGAGPIHLVECKAKPISFNNFYASGVKVFKIDTANLEGHVLSKIKTNSCYALVCFIFDKTFLLVLYPLRKELTIANISAGQTNIMSPVMSDMAIFVAVASVTLAGSYAAMTSSI